MNRCAKTAATRSCGFTLVELLVVIGVVAVLIALLMPALVRARTKAMTLVCMSNMRQLGMAEIMYANDNHDYFTPPRSSISTLGDFWYTTQSYTVTLNPYLTKKTSILSKAFVCPSYRPYDTSGSALAYGLNGRILGVWDNTNKKYTGFTKWQLRRNKPPRPYLTMLIGETNAVSDRMFGTTSAIAAPPSVSTSEGGSTAYRGSHGGMNNVLYVDGHVDTLNGFHLDATTDPVLQYAPDGTATTNNGYRLVKDFAMWQW